jgi:hypothetical protein
MRPRVLPNRRPRMLDSTITSLARAIASGQRDLESHSDYE